MHKNIKRIRVGLAIIMTSCLANEAMAATNDLASTKADKCVINSLQWKYEKIGTPKITTPAKMMDVVQEHTQCLLDEGRKLEELGACYSTVNTNYFAGDWGYTKKDACVIRQLDGGYDKLRIFGVMLEYIFAERRIWEEVWLNKLPDLHCIRFRRIKQSLVKGDDGKVYDCLEYVVTGFNEKDLEFLRKDYEAHGGYKEDASGLLKHEEMAAQRRKGYVTQYWFDITSFYGKGVQ